jgi:hypothetical protein
MRKILVCLSFCLVLACDSAPVFSQNGEAITHDIWNELLVRNVDSLGQVNYTGFIRDKDSLQDYLDLLSANPANSAWTKDAQLAYWINVYNAFTVKLIIDNYPLESIKDLHPTLKIPGLRTVWHKKFFEIGGVAMDLNTVEHKILRKEFDEPRIHFAIVCASLSCPSLLNEAYVADKLEDQLQGQAIRFVNDSFRNKIEKDNVQVSKIFSWFRGDFTKEGNLIDYLNQYSEKAISSDAKIQYLDYDWSLNE